VVDPALIVALGATAGQALFGSRFRVGASRGQLLDYAGRPLIATIHPSAVLRARDDSERGAQYAGFVADLRLAADVLDRENR
jgi:DNA polymerase